MIDLELDHLRAFAEDATRLNHCGYWCNACGSFWTMTGYGKEWHEPDCQRARVASLEQSVAALRAVKDGAYSERNKLVAALSKLFPASMERHDENDKTWEDDWRWIVFIDLPTGQATWHLHDSELPQFDHLTRGSGRKWDGHTTDEKYARLAAIPVKP